MVLSMSIRNPSGLKQTPSIDSMNDNNIFITFDIYATRTSPRRYIRQEIPRTLVQSHLHSIVLYDHAKQPDKPRERPENKGNEVAASVNEFICHAGAHYSTLRRSLLRLGVMPPNVHLLSIVLFDSTKLLNNCKETIQVLKRAITDGAT